MAVYLAVFGFLGVFVFFVLFWGREKTRHEVAAREKNQLEADLEKNIRVNDTYIEKSKTFSKNLNSVDPDDPWAGVR